MACSFFERPPQDRPNANVVPFSAAVRGPAFSFLKSISKTIPLPAFADRWLNEPGAETAFTSEV